MAERRHALDPSALPPSVEGTAVTVGTFDGVHRGHRDVLERLCARGAALGLPTLLVTFDPHPLEIVRPDSAPPLLSTWPEKLELLAETGIEYVAVLPFTPALARLEAEDFVQQGLVERFRMRHLLMGHDHGFGRGRTGDVETMRRLGARFGFEVEVVDPVASDQGVAISSTRVRRAVASGDLGGAAEMLGRAYAVSGRVVRGERRGRLLGFPTLNVDLPHPRKLLPPEGVYAVRVQTPRGPFGGMTNLGPRPTFGDARVGIEAHLFDAEGDWYGATVRVDFVARLRDTRKFPSAEALVEQLQIDAREARAALAVGRAGSVDATTASR